LLLVIELLTPQSSQHEPARPHGDVRGTAALLLTAKQGDRVASKAGLDRSTTLTKLSRLVKNRRVPRAERGYRLGIVHRLLLLADDERYETQRPRLTKTRNPLAAPSACTVEQSDRRFGGARRREPAA
jgi:hypothetical protein